MDNRDIVKRLKDMVESGVFPDITTWKQGQFIDSSQYGRMGDSWKQEQREREATLIRPHGGTNNALFMVEGTPQAPDITSYLENLGKQLEQLIKDLEATPGEE